MDTSSVPLKCCSRKEQCVHPNGPLLPATTEYFQGRKTRASGLRSQCKACTAFSKRQYRQRPEVREHERYHKREYDRARYQRPETKARIRGQRQRPEVRQRIREYDRQFSKLPDQRQRRYKYNQHPEVKRRASQRSAEYSKTERGRTVSKAQKAKRRVQSGGRLKAADIEMLYRTQRGRCWYCGIALNGKYHVEHRVPLSRGGSNDLRNIVVACADCNLHKHNKLPHEWGDRLL